MVVKIIDFSKASPLSALNPISAKVRQYIYAELQDGLRNIDVTSMVLTGGLQNFSAGADLTEFGSISDADLSSPRLAKNAPQDQKIVRLTLIEVVQALEDSEKPIVAAIAGACLGGGLELTLACHYRIAVDVPATKLALPEVHVGVIPGAGGTQRLPKVVGLETACQLILTGSSLGAKEALSKKLLDDTVNDPKELVEKAKQWALWAEVMPLNHRRLGRKGLSESPAFAHNVLEQAELSLPRYGSHGYQAALRAIRASFLPLDQGMAVESASFMETLVSEEGKARRHAFFAVRQAQKHVHPQIAKALSHSGHPLLSATNSKSSHDESAVVAVIGAGTMGSGISMVLLRAGFRVILVDIYEKALHKGMAIIKQTLESQGRRKKLKPIAVESMLSRLASSSRLEELGKCQLVVEAIVESMQLKQNLFSTLDRITSPSCILLTNTSTLDIDVMASVLKPERQQWFMGWHFFSPANVMKLVEIVKGSKTIPQAVTLMQLLSKKIDKIAVVVGNCDGFCGNRLLRPYSLEATYLVQEGVATIAQVDKAIVQFGIALGPFQMSDLAGNDVGYNIRKERGWVIPDNDKSRTTSGRKSQPAVHPPPPPPNRPARYSLVADVMVRDYGRIGQKVGKGWYDYDPTVGKGRSPLHSIEMERLLSSYASSSAAAAKSHAARAVDDSEIIRRCLYPLVNEGFKCLEEGIALSPSDIDVVYLYGYGWPTWRGGPMYWADHQVGLPHVLTWLQDMAREFPTSDHFSPSRLLKECVQRGITVGELFHTSSSGPNGSKL